MSSNSKIFVLSNGQNNPLFHWLKYKAMWVWSCRRSPPGARDTANPKEAEPRDGAQ